MTREAFVYIVGATERPVKIGRAENVYRRVADLQIASPSKLILHDFVMVPAALVAEVEAQAHRRFAGSRLQGEWFDLPCEEAARVVAQEAECSLEHHFDASFERATSDVFRLIIGGMVSPFAGRAMAELKRYPSRLASERAAMDAAVRAAGGQASAAIFDAVVVRGKLLRELFSPSDRTKIAKAEAALVVALNALIEHDARRRAAAILDAAA